jgi:hypothetical protein
MQQLVAVIVAELAVLVVRWFVTEVVQPHLQIGVRAVKPIT